MDFSREFFGCDGGVTDEGEVTSSASSEASIDDSTQRAGEFKFT